MVHDFSLKNYYLKWRHHHCLQNDPHDYCDIAPCIYNIENWLLKFKTYVKIQSSVIFDIIMQIKVNVLINNLIKDKYTQYHMEIVSFIFIWKWKKLQYFYINRYTHKQEQDAHHKHTGTKSVSMYTQSGFDFVTHYHMLAWRTATFRELV